MKIKDHRKREWWFYPHENSKLNKGRCYTFKYKSDLMNFLNSNFIESLSGEVIVNEDSFSSSLTIRSYQVWYNKKANSGGAKWKIRLCRNKSYRFRNHNNISKESKKYFAFSDKVINLMCNIRDEDGNITPNKAKRLVELFEKRGFKDFDPDEEDLRYINGHIEDGIDFYHWSDRCNWLRAKTIIDYFKREGLIK